MVKKLSFKKSAELYERAVKVVPGGTHSVARSAITFGTCEGFPIECPKFIEKAVGSRFYDVDGNSFIDYLMGYGSVILGHAHPKVKEAVKEQLDRGFLYGLNHENEIKLSEKIAEHVPCAEMALIMTSGSAAASAALRIARAHTGKEKIVKFDGHYHAWYDWNIFDHYPAGSLIYYGIPRSAMNDVIVLPWNDLGIVEDTVLRLGHEIAAVICEPYEVNSGVIPTKKGYLEGLRKITQEHNVVLIFDEIITGFKLGLNGAQGMFGVTPDLAIFGKALGNGFTISALAGKRSLMEPIRNEARLWLGGTFNSNPVSVVAALATITELEKEASYKHLYGVSEKLMKGFRDVIEDNDIEAIVQGPGPVFSLFFTDQDEITSASQVAAIPAYPHMKRAAVFYQEMINRGIFMYPFRQGRTNLSVSHSEEDVNKTIEAAGEAIKGAKKIE
jgi:glutamate-1-semialdehyde 2,1-aminomutase